MSFDERFRTLAADLSSLLCVPAPLGTDTGWLVTSLDAVGFEYTKEQVDQLLLRDATTVDLQRRIAALNGVPITCCNSYNYVTSVLDDPVFIPSLIATLASQPSDTPATIQGMTVGNPFVPSDVQPGHPKRRLANIKLNDTPILEALDSPSLLRMKDVDMSESSNSLPCSLETSAQLGSQIRELVNIMPVLRQVLSTIEPLLRTVRSVESKVHLKGDVLDHIDGLGRAARELSELERLVTNDHANLRLLGARRRSAETNDKWFAGLARVVRDLEFR